MSMIAAVTVPTSLPWWQSIIVLVPSMLAFGCAIASIRTRSIAATWALAKAATLLMVTGAGFAVVALLITGYRASDWLRIDAVGVAMLLLVSFIAWVIVRFSQSYLAGDPHERAYVSRLLTTLGMVGLVVVTNHFVLLLAAWAATSIALHGLLTYYSDRPVAVGVAHKKFLLARGADLCMVGAAVAFVVTLDTLRIDRIVSEVSSRSALPGGVRIAVMLIAIAALLKSAQLPFHGWLIQVMEAPTPISALLHAGIVNLGGFVLLRFAGVVDRAIETRTVLVIVGTITAVVAAIVMTTRISIKVSLAWSTCAQMGFMLMQCGLGLWEMALLHLIAHSLYKAHAFLGAGGVVLQTQRRQLLPKYAPLRLTSIASALAPAIAGTLIAGFLAAWLPFIDRPTPALWVLGGIVAVALVPLLTHSLTGSRSPGSVGHDVRLKAIASGFTVAFVYFSLHGLFAQLVDHGATPPAFLVVGVAFAFVSLFTMQIMCMVFPMTTWIQRLYPWFYGGLFIDEAFTRFAFRLWPPPRITPSRTLLPDRSALPSASFATALASGC